MRFWNFRNSGAERPAGAGAAAPDGVLDIDGEIVADAGWFGEDGVCVARDFRKALDGFGKVTVRINSPGGDVMAGADIYSALREHSMNGRGEVTVIIGALAASAASVIAMAGDRILMSPTAYMMIHNPWTAAVGDAREMRKAARTLDEISQGIINAYQVRTGKSRDELKRMLDNETWMSAYTCVENGFADEIIGAAAGSAGLRAVACLMSGRSHGAAEIAARIRDEAEEPEEPEKPETEPEEAPETEPEEAPETEPEEAPETEPEEAPEEEPEHPDEEARALARLRAAALAMAADAWEESF